MVETLKSKFTDVRHGWAKHVGRPKDSSLRWSIFSFCAQIPLKYAGKSTHYLKNWLMKEKSQAGCAIQRNYTSGLPNSQ